MQNLSFFERFDLLLVSHNPWILVEGVFWQITQNITTRPSFFSFFATTQQFGPTEFVTQLSYFATHLESLQQVTHQLAKRLFFFVNLVKRL